MGHRVPARWWKPDVRQRVQCTLCPRYCRIPNDSRGFCFLRENHSGRLYTAAFGLTCGLTPDPIEKKPLYHFYPGSFVLSFGTLGCNLGCKYCQNWHLSRSEGVGEGRSPVSHSMLVARAKDLGCVGIAYTYNEPIVFAEWMLTVAKKARLQGLKNVMVTNGYVAPEARSEVFQFIDAVNVDLKGFNEQFYRKLTLSHLEPVLDTLRWLVTETEIWVEITTLLIPGVNDAEQELEALTRFIASELNPQIPLHFTAFHPEYRMSDHPVTPVERLKHARTIARGNGLQYVYWGNVMSLEGQSTFCPGCGEKLIQRRFYSIQRHLTGNMCPRCGTFIPGYYSSERAVS